MPPRYYSTALTVIAVIVAFVAASAAQSVIAPLAAALLTVAVIWPVQARCEAYLPRYLALVVSVIVIVACFAAFGSLAAWAFGRVTRWIVAEAGRFQNVYIQMTEWLEGHGIAIAGVWSEHFNASWLLRTLQGITSRLNTTLSFWLVVFIYVILLLLEVRDFERRAHSLRNQQLGQLLVEGTQQAAAKLRRYMVVRTQMSLATGVLVWGFAQVIGFSLRPSGV